MADSLAELQGAIEAFVAERDWAQFHAPKNLAMGVAIEAAEIMEHFLWCTGEESHALGAGEARGGRQRDRRRADLPLELGRALDIDVIAARGQARHQPREISGREGQGPRDEVRRSRLTRRRRRRTRHGWAGTAMK